MNQNNEDASKLIWKLWSDGAVTEALPETIRPASREEGYAIQHGLEVFSSSARYGWKIAATSEAGQAHIGVDGPLAGRVLAETVFEPGAVIDVSNNRMRVVEPEFAFRFGQAIEPREQAYSVDEVLAAVEDLHLCLELPDSRFADFASVGGPTLIADNACAWKLVAGPAVDADWRTIDLSQHEVCCSVGDRYTRQGIGSNVLGDPREALAWLVNEVSSLGITIEAGELVTTGTCTIPLEIEPGDQVSADFGDLGRISVRISS